VEFSRLAMRKAFRTVWWLTLPWFLVFVVAVGIMIINADVFARIDPPWHLCCSAIPDLCRDNRVPFGPST